MPAEKTPQVAVIGKINIDAVAAELFGGLHNCAGRFLGPQTSPADGKTYVGYAGGSGFNPAVALARLGLRAVLVGAIGNDLQGQWVKEQLRIEGVVPQLEIFSADEFPVEDGYAPTEWRTGMINIGRDSRGERTFSAPAPSANRHLGDTRLVTGSIENLLRSTDAVLISGWSLFGGPEERANREFLDRVFRYSQTNDIKVVLDLSNAGIMRNEARDARGEVRGYARLADIVKANGEEIEQFAGGGDLVNAINLYSVAVRGGGKKPHIVLATLGEKGSMIFEGNGCRSVKPCGVRRVLDTTGAGDAYAATFLGLILLGYNNFAAARGASFAGARVVGQFGGTTGLPERGEVEAFLKREGYVREGKV
jgi:sugar/nucleoside kinase (ribokinase family)